MQKKIILSAFALLVLTIGAAVIFYQQANLKPSSKELVEKGFFLFESARELKPVELVDLEGEAISITEGNGQWQMVHFGYIFCPDFCPTNLGFMGEIKSAWEQQSELPLSLTHITFDPERDTPEKLSLYLSYIDDNLKGLTGELEEIRKIATQLSTVFIYEEPDQYGNYFISHSNSIALLNPTGQFVGLFKGPYDKQNVLDALGQVIN